MLVRLALCPVCRPNLSNVHVSRNSIDVATWRIIHVAAGWAGRQFNGDCKVLALGKMSRKKSLKPAF